MMIDIYIWHNLLDHECERDGSCSYPSQLSGLELSIKHHELNTLANGNVPGISNLVRHRLSS